MSETTAETRRASHEATDKGRGAARVIEALTELGAATALEILDYVQLHHAPNAEIRNVSARVCELSKAGKIEIASDEDGQPIKKMERYGKRNAVYQLATPLRVAQVELLDAPVPIESDTLYCNECQARYHPTYFSYDSMDKGVCVLCNELPADVQLTLF